MESKIKNWADKLRVEPDDKVWNKIETKIQSGVIKKKKTKVLNTKNLHYINLLTVLVLLLILVCFLIFYSAQKKQNLQGTPDKQSIGIK